ncbi:glycoside hydrolase family 10 protein [Pareuzebyella sediminis]|uniref:hypothetical protein n=1 Tax=Pareuzebyella sediminis TaxID=2607998 RepID=UPI0011F0015A|nr:hypothetical protein [Pareuzebyella sediminis]
MPKYLLNIILFSSLLLVSSIHCTVIAQEEAVQIRGVYGNPNALWRQGYTLPELGVNSIFVHSGSLNKALMQRAQSENIMVFAEFATLNGKNYVEKHPEAWPILKNGEKAPAASWFMGVCPTDSDFRNYRMAQLRELLSKFRLDGIWMDYVHWHAQFEEPETILPETCFNESCLTAFTKASGVIIPHGTLAEKANWILTNEEEKWRKWRTEVVFSWAQEIKQIVKSVRPNALVGLYHCPWKDDEFNGARERILGLDYDLLKTTVDVFSPMVYHKRMGRKPDWVAENTMWLSERLETKDKETPKIWPIVQAYNDPETISPEEFLTVLRGGLSGKSSGIMMFTTAAVAEDPRKIRAMKDFYLALDTLQKSNRSPR